MRDFSCTFIPSVFSCECKLNKDGTIKSFEDIELKEHGCVKVYYKGKKIYSIRFMLSEDEIKRCFKEDITMVSSTKRYYTWQRDRCLLRYVRLWLVLS